MRPRLTGWADDPPLLLWCSEPEEAGSLIEIFALAANAARRLRKTLLQDIAKSADDSSKASQ